MENHLVTGGNGYLGSAIASHLLDLGHNVTIVDVIDDKNRDPRINFMSCDVRDRNTLAKALKDIDVVHHNAALVPLKKAGNDFWDVNVIGTQNVVELSERAGVRHISHMSSSAVFGNVTDSDCPIKGTPDSLFPIEIYGKSKKAGEDIIFSYLERSSRKMTASVIRPRTIIGGKRLGIFSILFKWILENRNIYIIGSGNNLFQFAHLEDLVNASVISANNNIDGALNIGTDKYSTLRDTLETFIKEVNSTSKVISLPVGMSISALRLLDKMRLSPLGPWHYLTYHKPYVFDLTNEKKLLSWSPRKSNNQMLKEAYDSYLIHLKSQSENTNDDTSPHKSDLSEGILKILRKIS